MELLKFTLRKSIVYVNPQLITYLAEYEKGTRIYFETTLVQVDQPIDKVVKMIEEWSPIPPMSIILNETAQDIVNQNDQG